jgi:hypothetical protein
MSRIWLTLLTKVLVGGLIISLGALYREREIREKLKQIKLAELTRGFVSYITRDRKKKLSVEQSISTDISRRD